MSEAWFFALWSDLLADDWHGATVQWIDCPVLCFVCKVLVVLILRFPFQPTEVPLPWQPAGCGSCMIMQQVIPLVPFARYLIEPLLRHSRRWRDHELFHINGCQHSVVCDPNSWLNPSVDVIDAWQILACLLSFNRCPFHSSKCHNRLLTLILQFSLQFLIAFFEPGPQFAKQIIMRMLCSRKKVFKRYMEDHNTCNRIQNATIFYGMHQISFSSSSFFSYMIHVGSLFIVP